MATDTATALKAEGFPIESIANADLCAGLYSCPEHSMTTIHYPPGQESGARTLHDRYPQALVQASSEVTVLTLTLGTEGGTPSE